MKTYYKHTFNNEMIIIFKIINPYIKKDDICMIPIHYRNPPSEEFDKMWREEILKGVVYKLDYYNQVSIKREFLTEEEFIMDIL